LARGVLLDAASHSGVDRLPPEAVITRADLEEIAEAQNVKISEGDVLLVRTGYGGLWDEPASYLRAAGVSSDGSRWAAEHKVLAVGADNTAWEVMGAVDPDLGVSLGGHLILLVRNGIYILEHLFLEELARDRCYQFLFVCLPLKLRGATGSPVRPLALVPDPTGLAV
jgi:kynurenine formamidase